MKRIISLSLKNVGNTPGRNIILALCVAVLTALQAAASIVDLSAAAALEKGLARLGADLMLVPKTYDVPAVRAYMTGEPAAFYMPAGIMRNIRQFPFIETASPQLYVKSLSGASCCSAWDVFLIGFDPSTDFTVRPWLKKDTTALGSNDILCGAGINMPVGASVRFYGEAFRVAGILEPGGMGLDSSIFIPMNGARRMIENSGRKAERPLAVKDGDVSAILIKLKSEARGGIPAWKAAHEIERRLDAITVIRPADITRKAKNNLSGLLSLTATTGFALWPVCALLMALIFAMIVSERRREIGLLYALGATRFHIFTMIECEAFVVSLAGAVIGALAAWGGVALFSGMIALKLAIPLTPVMAAKAAAVSGRSVALAMLAGCLSAFIPALRATLLEPYEAIRR